MKYIIGNVEITLHDEVVEYSKCLLLAHLDMIKKNNIKHNRPEFYFTYLLIMHKLTGEILQKIGEDGLQLL